VKLIELSVKRSVTVAMAFVALIVFSFVSFTKLNIDMFPDITFPMAVVSATYSGAGPEEVETLVTKPIEGAVGSVQGITDIQSVSSTGNTMVMLTFSQSTDMDFATLQMREKIDLVKPYLPGDTENIMVIKMDPSMIPVYLAGVTGGQNLSELTKIAEDVIVPRLERVNGVASVSVIGGQERQIRISANPVSLAAFGLTTTSLSQLLSSENLDYSVGTVNEGDKEITVRIIGEYQSLDDIRATLITLPSGSTIRLSDIATVMDSVADKSQISRVNGKDSVTFQVMKQSDANTVAVANGVEDELQKVAAELPNNFQAFTLFSQADYIEMMIRDLAVNAILGALLAILIIFLFLGDLKMTVLLAVSIPTSLFGAFTLLYLNNMTLNMMTLGGLALGAGMLVDDSIVILEGIFRHREKGVEPKAAAITGASELFTAVFASTLTIIAVFLPIVFAEGLAAMFFSDFALTVAFTLLASLIVAITLVPMLSSKVPLTHMAGGKSSFLKKMNTWSTATFQKIVVFYEKILRWAMNHRKKVVLLIGATLIISLALIPFVGAELMPAGDSGEIIITADLDKGSSLQASDEVAGQIEKSVLALKDELDNVSISIGGSSMGSYSTSKDSVSGYVILVPKTERERGVVEIGEQLREEFSKIPGAKITVDTAGSMGMMFSTGAPISYSIRGQDLTVLQGLANQLKTIMENTPGTVTVATSMDESRPELQVRVNREKASQYGLSVYQIASVARSVFMGDTVTSYHENGEEVDVKIYLPETYRTTIDDLRMLMITTHYGTQVPLSDVAALNIEQSPVSINRENNARVITVTSQIEGNDLGGISKAIDAQIASIALPQGYSIETGGSVEEMSDSFADLTLALFLAIILVYLVMASIFESLIHPFIILFSLPTAIIGVVFALFITGRTLNLASFIGLVMLVGIVVRNAIVLVDCINRMREEYPENMTEAIITAGKIRLRPVLMTSLTTILGMLPLALATGEGSEMSNPLATVLVGGMVFSTFLTLVFIPVVYSIVIGWEKKVKAKWHRRFHREALQAEIVEGE